jgi:hypothetical protein
VPAGLRLQAKRSGQSTVGSRPIKCQIRRGDPIHHANKAGVREASDVANKRILRM